MSQLFHSLINRFKELAQEAYRLFVLPPEFYYREEKIKLNQKQERLRHDYWQHPR